MSAILIATMANVQAQSEPTQTTHATPQSVRKTPVRINELMSTPQALPQSSKAHSTQTVTNTPESAKPQKISIGYSNVRYEKEPGATSEKEKLEIQIQSMESKIALLESEGGHETELEEKRNALKEAKKRLEEIETK